MLVPTMHLKHCLVQLLCATVVVNAATIIFNLNCDKITTPCNNDCYAIMNANRPRYLTWPNKGKDFSSDNRKKAGCDPNPCCGKKPKMEPPSQGEKSCDEYPFASTDQGGDTGDGAILRCVDEDENTTEGSRFSAILTGSRYCNKMPGCMIMFGVNSNTVSDM